MKKIIMLTLLLLLSHIALSQSLIIYKTDHTKIDFKLSDVDSITFSVTSLAKSLDLSNWECMTIEPALEKVNPVAGVLEKVTEGLKIYGNDNQLNQAVRLASLSDNPIMDKTIYLKWKANGNNGFMNVTINLYADTTYWTSAYSIINLTTNHPSDGSQVIFDDTWYYTRIVITSNKAISTTAFENYDSNGGAVIQELSTNLSEAVKAFTFGTKAPKVSNVILGEVRIE
jgi:hypothetical protein